MRKSFTLSLALVACWLAGCTDLSVHQLPPSAANAPLVGDITYYLPRTAIIATGTVTLKSCNAVWDATAKAYQPDIKATATLVPVQTIEPDPNHHYYISYEESRSWMKEINFSVSSTAAGTLGTFNGTINDQAGPVIVATVGAVVQIGGAIASGGVPVPAIVPNNNALGLHVAGAAPPQPPKYCSDSVLTGLAEIAKAQKVIDDAKAAPAQTTAGQAVQTQLISAAQSKIDAAVTTYKLARTFSFRWAPDPVDPTAIDSPTAANIRLVSKEVDVTPLVDEWLTSVGKTWLHADLSSAPDNDPRRTLTAPFLLALAVDETTMGQPLPASPGGRSGLIVRDPANAVLRVCRESSPGCTVLAAAQPDGKIVETTSDLGTRMALKLPQFGRMMVLPEHSALFENATLSVTLNPDSTISTIGYHSVSSLAAGITGLGSAANSATSAIAQRNTAIAAANTATAAETTARTAQIQAPNTYNSALAACLASQAAILKAGSDRQPEPC